MESLGLHEYPPTPVAWGFYTVDTICYPLGCSEWRQLLPSQYTQEGAWLSDQYRAGHIAEGFLKLTTYREFLQQTNAEPSLASLKQFAFETPSTTLADLTTPSSWAVLLVIVLLLRQVKSVLMPIFSEMGRKAGRKTHGPGWEAENEVRIVKFGEYVFRLLFHSILSIVGIWYFWDKPWWTGKDGGTETLYQNYPLQEIMPGMIWYYLIQSGYNLDAMLSLLVMSFQINFREKQGGFPISIGWSPKARGDFREMFIHHVVTNILVLGSSYFRVTRIGSMVFLVHDISDVPVDMSKLAHFVKWKAATAFCFTMMVVVWCMTRLGALPFIIFRSIVNEAWMVCQAGVLDPIIYVLYQPVFVVLIGVLILLHFAWFIMFIQMGYTLVVQGEAHDYSEHKTGEHEMEAKKTN